MCVHLVRLSDSEKKIGQQYKKLAKPCLINKKSILKDLHTFFSTKWRTEKNNPVYKHSFLMSTQLFARFCT